MTSAQSPASRKRILLFRIGTDTKDYEANDHTGKGAEITGGRWNRKGTPLIYASTTRALACLETIVHLGVGSSLPLNRYLVEIKIPSHWMDSIKTLRPKKHVGWDATPPGRTSIDWGTKWAQEAKAPVVKVPSVVVPEEHNVLINPTHPEANRVRIRKVRRWTYDPRLR